MSRGAHGRRQIQLQRKRKRKGKRNRLAWYRYKKLVQLFNVGVKPPCWLSAPDMIVRPQLLTPKTDFSELALKVLS